MSFKAVDGWSKVYEKIPLAPQYTYMFLQDRREEGIIVNIEYPIYLVRTRECWKGTAEQTAKEGKVSSGKSQSSEVSHDAG